MWYSMIKVMDKWQGWNAEVNICTASCALPPNDKRQTWRTPVMCTFWCHLLPMDTWLASGSYELHSSRTKLFSLLTEIVQLMKVLIMDRQAIGDNVTALLVWGVWGSQTELCCDVTQLSCGWCGDAWRSDGALCGGLLIGLEGQLYVSCPLGLPLSVDLVGNRHRG